jgi:mRNA interferase RelE/StbE
VVWTVVFHREVLSRDLPAIPSGPRERILVAIARRLAAAPESYGKPLRAPLSGFRRLRVGEYRVVYRVEKTRIVVEVVSIGIRRDEEVYAEVARRLRRI